MCAPVKKSNPMSESTIKNDKVLTVFFFFLFFFFLFRDWINNRKLNHNQLMEIPDLGPVVNLSSLNLWVLFSNRILTEES